MRDCASCGEANPDKARFCLACGSPLSASGCGSCGEENPPNARFCWSCGAPLAAGRAPEELRKTVTVLFVDLVGSTELGALVDPESLKHVMGRYFDAASAAIARHGGSVEKFIGDAVMAVFGARVMSEDDPLRALRAAVDVREAVDALNLDLEREWGVQLAIRTGVNTGQLLIGDRSPGHALVGDVVNLAARLQQLAAPGDIYVGQSTYELVGDISACLESLQPLVVKGWREPIRVWRLVQVLPTAEPSYRRLDLPLLERDGELVQLREALDRAVETRGPQLVALLGEAGVGKSRLATTFAREVEDTARVLVGRCLAYGEGITFWPLREIIHRAVTGETREGIRAVMAADEDADLIAERIAGAIGETDDPAGPEETFRAVRRFVSTLAQRVPLILVFEDIHWAEPTLLDLVEHLAEWTRDAPILLLCLARNELLDTRPAWNALRPHASIIRLEPLSEAGCEACIDQMADRVRLSSVARARILDAAGGNPLFLEQMLAMLVEDRSGSEEVSVPPTIKLLLAARLDRLSRGERAVAQRAAVVGKEFWHQAVAQLEERPERPEVGRHLIDLVRKDLIRPSPSDFFDDDAFSFRHILIRDAAYDAIPKDRRADFHQRFASWFAETRGERAAEFAEILGYHLEQALLYRLSLHPPDERSKDLAQQASGWLARAGARALTRGDMPAAVNLLGRAVDLLPVGSPSRLELLTPLGEALTQTGDFTLAERVLSEAVQGAAAAGDRRLEANAVVARTFVRAATQPRSVWDEAGQVAGWEISVLEEAGDNQGLVRAHLLLAQDAWVRGRLGGQSVNLEAALAAARRAADGRLEFEILGWLAMSLAWGPAPTQEASARCETFLREAGGHRTGGVSQVLNALACLRAMRGRFSEARTLLGRSKEILEDVGHRLLMAGLWQISGEVERLAGDPIASERELRCGYDAFSRMGERDYMSTIAAQLAHALIALGRDTDAEALTRVSREAAPIDDAFSQILWRTARAKILARRGDLAAAVQVAGEAVRIASRTDFLPLHADALSDLGEVLRLTGRSEAATASFAAALRLNQLKENLVSSGRVEAALDALDLRQLH